MANNPTEKTPVTGSATHPVNVSFTGPNAGGKLNDLPPMVTSGLDASPLIAINGVEQNKLGIQDGESPKTHG